MESEQTVEESSEARTRKASQERKSLTNEPRGYKTICMPLYESEYSELVDEPLSYRTYVDEVYGKDSELFPKAMSEGYTLHDKLPYAKKLPDIRLRRIKRKADDEVYTIRPSFVLPI